MKVRGFLAALLLSGCATAPLQQHAAPAYADARVLPALDHHQHLVSATAAAQAFAPPLAEVQLPADLAALLAQRQQVWNDAEGLSRLLTPTAIVLNTLDDDMPSWIRGRETAAYYLSRAFGRAHRIKPVAFEVRGNAAHIEGYYFRPELNRHFGHALLVLERSRSGEWLIAAETPTFPGPRSAQEFDAERLIAQLDEAGIRRATVLSVAYWFGSEETPSPNERELVRAENDWVAEQVALYPDRLLGFCSFSPLRDYALDELNRCADSGRFNGVKLHLGNSRVDLSDPEQVARLQAVFATANRRGLAIVAHLWTGPEYEANARQLTETFVNDVLSQAPDVPVQIAHLAGGGRTTEEALEVLAEALERRAPGTQRLYFDASTSVEGRDAEGLRRDVEMMRRIGLQRILYGTDLAPPNPPAREAWASFHMFPFTDGEIAAIAGNVAPYAQ